VSDIRPWQVWLVDFGQPVGSEQRGVRPAVIVASDLHCRFPIEMTIVVPLTTRDRRLPHHVLVDSRDSGLNRPSWARTEDVTSVSTARLVSKRPLGRLSESEVANVGQWLLRMIAHPGS
jgi:mRNA interferase MazF